MVFKEGIPGWKAAGFKINTNTSDAVANVPVIDLHQFNASLNSYLVIDIRPSSAYKLGYIAGSRAIPLPYLSMFAKELPKESKVVVVDHNGKRSKKAALWLMANGFPDVRLLEGGLTKYAKAGFPLEK